MKRYDLIIISLHFYHQPQAVAAFDNVAGIGNGCREPCVKTVTVFGFPFLSDELTLDSAYAKLYFKNIVKVTEDYLSYTFLSMIAEIGGYAGLMIGFSILDFVSACQVVSALAKSPVMK